MSNSATRAAVTSASSSARRTPISALGAVLGGATRLVAVLCASLFSCFVTHEARMSRSHRLPTVFWPFAFANFASHGPADIELKPRAPFSPPVQKTKLFLGLNDGRRLFVDGSAGFCAASDSVGFAGVPAAEAGTAGVLLSMSGEATEPEPAECEPDSLPEFVSTGLPKNEAIPVVTFGCTITN